MINFLEKAWPVFLAAILLGIIFFAITITEPAYKSDMRDLVLEIRQIRLLLEEHSRAEDVCK